MRMRTLWQKLRARAPMQPVTTDWTIGWSLRDLADLPTHRPRDDR
jgi:hypothetical protein